MLIVLITPPPIDEEVRIHYVRWVYQLFILLEFLPVSARLNLCLSCFEIGHYVVRNGWDLCKGLHRGSQRTWNLLN